MHKKNFKGQMKQEGVRRSQRRIDANKELGRGRPKQRIHDPHGTMIALTQLQINEQK